MLGSLSGIFNSAEKYNVDNCTKLTGPSDFDSCETVVLSNTPGVLYALCDPMKRDVNTVMGHNHLKPGQAIINGGLWRVDYRETPVIQKLNMVNVFDSHDDFHPLGMTLDIHPTTGQELLLAINLAHHKQPSIEVFRIEGTDVVHMRTIRHKKISHPNSLHVFHDDRFMDEQGIPSFFFTNDHYFHNTLLKKIENIFLAYSNVGFYNTRTDDVDKGVNGLLFGNGLTGDDEHLYVAESFRQTVKQYKIVVKSYPNDAYPRVTLNYVSEATFNMAVDNLYYDASHQEVYVTGHPKPLQFLYYVNTANKDTMTLPPSEVSKWNLNTDNTTLVLRDDGSLYGAATTVIIDHAYHTLIVSSLMDKGLLLCPYE